MTKTKWLKILAVLAVPILGAGCESMHTRYQRDNNLFTYLYSDQKGHIDAPGIPVLSLPLRVGIAFVPADCSNSREDTAFSESDKIALMKQVSEQFKKHPFVKTIELIPTTYLSPKGG